MVNEFIVPKEPRLAWRMLLPKTQRSGYTFPAKGRTHHLFWARNAIYHGLRALRIAPGDNVLVPAFHCTSVVEPILKYGAKVKFYNISQDLRPDLADIESKVDGKTRAILAIHYFGFPQAIQRIKEFSRRYGIFFIEDCAHVLTGSTEEGTLIGSVGDISIFSWRKFLPLYDGGQLVINNPEIDLAIPWDRGDFIFSLKVTKNVLDKLIDDSDSKLVQKLGRISRVFSALARGIALTNGQRSKAFAINSYDRDFDVSLANLRMSTLSKYILKNTDITDVVAKRRANYTRLLEFVKSLSGVDPLYPSLPENVCPWIFPMLAHGIKNFHVLLRSKGIPAFTWSGVIHPDLCLDEFPHSRFLYDNLVFLPIHQNIGDGDLKTMVTILIREISNTD